MWAHFHVGHTYPIISITELLLIFWGLRRVDNSILILGCYWNSHLLSYGRVFLVVKVFVIKSFLHKKKLFSVEKIFP